MFENGFLYIRKLFPSLAIRLVAMARERFCTMQLLYLLHAVAIVAGYKFFQQRIPNGEMVPHPCKPNFLWRGVGHENLLGGGDRNAFGQAFEENGLVWNEAICMQDSDSDGKTNGVELGDPNCTWTQGTAPKYTAGLSHPGICEPIDSENCKNKTGFVDCDAPEFDCPVLDDPVAMTFNYTVTIPETTVPERETTYACMNFALPADCEYHLVATKPVIDEANVIHHIVVYGCPGVDDENELNSPLNTLYNCGMAADRKCTDIISLWTVGLAGMCFHDNAGFLIGGTSGYKYAAFQIHWNNPELRNDYMDASGMAFYLTPKLRSNNAGIVMIGQLFIEIPPGKESYDVNGSCKPECTSNLASGVFVTAAINHMHYLGKSQVSELIRDGERVEYLAEDRTYNYDSPVVYDHKKEIEVKPGDEIKTTCTYKSTSRTTVTRGGGATSNEMCYVFLMYYPKEKMPITTCTQSRGLSYCPRYNGGGGDGSGGGDGVVQECDTRIFCNPKHPQMVAITQGLFSKCSISHCKPDCLEYVKQVKKNPCLQGDLNIEHREYTYGLQGETKSNTLMFYALLDSCDVEIEKGACAEKPTSGGSWFSASFSFYLSVVFALFYV